MGTQESFGSLVRRYRRDAELTQEALAERAGLSIRAIRNIEAGTRHRPRRDTLELLLAALAIPADEQEEFLRAAGQLPSGEAASEGLQGALASRLSQLLTILIADLRGYTDYTIEHGDDAAARLTQQFSAATAAVAASFGGTVLELRGDEAVCVFASARQAVRAAIGMQERYCSEAERDQLPLRAGIGLDAGEVVTVEDGYRGHALNLASQLCSLAGPSDVLISEGLVHLAQKIEGIAYIDRGYEQVKGVAEPVRVIAAVSETEVAAVSAGEAEAPSRLPVGSFLGALPAGRLVGREEEMREIAEALDSAVGKEGRLLLVAGERGMGRTRLAQEVSVEARRRGFLIGTGRCYESQRDLPYYPFLEALTKLLHAAPAPLRAGAGRRWPHLARLLPEELSVVPTPATDALEEQARLYRSVTGFVAACSEHAPVALLLDDLHWCDERSLDLLAHLARNTRANAVLLLATYAEDGSTGEDAFGRFRRELGRERLLDRLTLRRLPPEGTAQLVSSLMAGTIASPELVELVQRRTRGRPFFVEEMVRALGGRYQLVSEMGAGGMGRVFQAVDTRDDSPVAVKILFASSEAGVDALLRFQQEAAVLSTLTHPNIVKVKGKFLEEHVSCIIMELLDGVSLTEMLRSRPPDLARTKYILTQVAAALAYAHDRNIIHRDIKPDNIMILAGDEVKVTDFGIARVLGVGATLHTATGMGIGTPLYMAPEQIEGSDVDGRADIYSLGAVLYQMVTGTPPFEGDDPITIGFKHLQETPRPPAEIAATLPDDWEDLILRMLAKDPADRPQTAREVQAAIEALSTEPASSDPQAPEGRVRTPAAEERAPGTAPAAPGLRRLLGRATPLALGAAALALVAVAAVVVGVLSFAGGSSVASPPAALVADASWGSSTKANSTDTAITSIARGVSVSNAFPDGTAEARCFIQVTSKHGPQPVRFGDCTGITLTVTCASASYNLAKLAPSGRGLSLSINGRPSWRGAYDQGVSPPCQNHPRGIDDSLAAHLAGVTPGQAVVWLVGGDNGGHVYHPDSTQRNGCFRYIEATGTSPVRCVQTDFARHLGSYYDEVTATGTSGDLVETARRGIKADLTLQGVFLKAPGSGAPLPDSLNTPADVSVDSHDNVYIADSDDNLVEERSPSGVLLTVWRGGRRGPFEFPQAAVGDGSGNVYVADTFHSRVVKLSRSGLRIAPWGTGDSGRGSLSEPVALALDGHGDLWVLDADTLFSGLRTPSLLEYSPAGRLIKQGRLQLATVSDPLIGGIALDGRGHIEVTQDAGQRETRADINVYSASLLSSTYVNRPVSTFSMYGSRRSQYRGGSASGITHDRLGDTYIADAYNNRISVLSPSGAWLFAVGRHGASARGIAVDSHGNVYVADPINNRVQRLVPRKRTR